MDQDLYLDVWNASWVFGNFNKGSEVEVSYTQLEHGVQAIVQYGETKVVRTFRNRGVAELSVQSLQTHLGSNPSNSKVLLRQWASGRIRHAPRKPSVTPTTVNKQFDLSKLVLEIGYALGVTTLSALLAVVAWHVGLSVWQLTQ